MSKTDARRNKTESGRVKISEKPQFRNTYLPCPAFLKLVCSKSYQGVFLQILTCLTIPNYE